MRKLVLTLVIVFFLSVLMGCTEFQTQTFFDIDENGEMRIKIVLKADKVMTGNQAKTFVWGLINAIPELQNNYTLTKEVKTIDYSDYLFYTFESRERISVEKNRNITFTQDEGGTYRFELKIPALLSEISESEKDIRAYTISVTLPKEIDLANTQYVEGRTAKWTIYYHNLIEGTKLKASTK